MDSNELKRSIKSAQEAIYALANEVSKTGEVKSKSVCKFATASSAG